MKILSLSDSFISERSALFSALKKIKICMLIMFNHLLAENICTSILIRLFFTHRLNDKMLNFIFIIVMPFVLVVVKERFPNEMWSSQRVGLERLWVVVRASSCHAPQSKRHQEICSVARNAVRSAVTRLALAGLPLLVQLCFW